MSSKNIIMAPSIFKKSEVKKMLGVRGNNQSAVWNYGDYKIWFCHLSKQTKSGGWISTTETGRINILYQKKDDAVIIEMSLPNTPIKKSNGDTVLIFASDDESTNFMFRGVFKCYDTNDGVIDKVFKRISKGFDINEKRIIS